MCYKLIESACCCPACTCCKSVSNADSACTLFGDVGTYRTAVKTFCTSIELLVQIVFKSSTTSGCLLTTENRSYRVAKCTVLPVVDECYTSLKTCNPIPLLRMYEYQYSISDGLFIYNTSWWFHKPYPHTSTH